MTSAFHRKRQVKSSGISLSKKLGVRLPTMTSPKPYKGGSFLHRVQPFFYSLPLPLPKTRKKKTLPLCLSTHPRGVGSLGMENSGSYDCEISFLTCFFSFLFLNYYYYYYYFAVIFSAVAMCGKMDFSRAL